jgi:hypothetical protein
MHQSDLVFLVTKIMHTHPGTAEYFGGNLSDPQLVARVALDSMPDLALYITEIMKSSLNPQQATHIATAANAYSEMEAALNKLAAT